MVGKLDTNKQKKQSQTFEEKKEMKGKPSKDKDTFKKDSGCGCK